MTKSYRNWIGEELFAKSLNVGRPIWSMFVETWNTSWSQLDYFYQIYLAGREAELQKWMTQQDWNPVTEQYNGGDLFYHLTENIRRLKQEDIGKFCEMFKKLWNHLQPNQKQSCLTTRVLGSGEYKTFLESFARSKGLYNIEARTPLDALYEELEKDLNGVEVPPSPEAQIIDAFTDLDSMQAADYKKALTSLEEVKKEHAGSNIDLVLSYPINQSRTVLEWIQSAPSVSDEISEIALQILTYWLENFETELNLIPLYKSLKEMPQSPKVQTCLEALRNHLMAGMNTEKGTASLAHFLNDEAKDKGFSATDLFDKETLLKNIMDYIQIPSMQEVLKFYLEHYVSDQADVLYVIDTLQKKELTPLVFDAITQCLQVKIPLPSEKIQNLLKR